MRKAATSLAVLSLLLMASPVLAQSDGRTIGRVVSWRAKPGMTEEMERGLKKHMKWHKDQNDPWAWLVWQTVSGKDTGLYGAGTFGHKWEDFDTPNVPEEEDQADVEANVIPYSEQAVVQYYSYLGDVSRERQSDGPPKMVEVLTFRVHSGKNQQFNRLIRKFQEAADKTDWPVHYLWHAVVNGGEGSQYILVFPRDKWADFAPPEKAFEQMLEEAFGRGEAVSLLDQLWETVKSTERSIAKTRPDLSYTPSPEE